MHRSGTSLVIGLLELHQYYLGKVSAKTSEFKPTGTKEHLLVREINNEILASAGANWSQPDTPREINSLLEQKIIATVKELQSHKLWALKDPRFVFTYEVWQKYLPAHQVMYCIRAADEVAQSLYQKNKMPINEGLRLWHTYNKKLLELMKFSPGPLIEFKSRDTVYAQFRHACQCLGTAFNGPAVDAFYQHKDQAKKSNDVVTQELNVIYNQILELAISRGDCEG